MKKFLFVLVSLFLFVGLFQARVWAEEMVVDDVVAEEYVYTPRLLPGSRFYFLKGWKEKVELALASSAEGRVAKRIESANRRLSEVKALLSDNPELAANWAEKYQGELVLLKEEMEDLPENRADWLKEHLAQVNLEHYRVMLEIYSQAPKALQERIEASLRENMYERALESLPEEKRLKLEEREVHQMEQVLEEMEGEQVSEGVLEQARNQVVEEIRSRFKQRVEEVQERVRLRSDQE